jgi:hypothetical protein
MYEVPKLTPIAFLQIVALESVDTFTLSIQHVCVFFFYRV